MGSQRKLQEWCCMSQTNQDTSNQCTHPISPCLNQTFHWMRLCLHQTQHLRYSVQQSNTSTSSVELNDLPALLDEEHDTLSDASSNILNETPPGKSITSPSHGDSGSVPHLAIVQEQPQQHHMQLWPHKPHQYALNMTFHFLTREELMGIIFMMEQMSLKWGLQLFGDKGADVAVSEMWQLDYQQIILPRHANKLIKAQQFKAIRYLMYLKQKFSRKIKVRGMCQWEKTKSVQIKTWHKLPNCINGGPDWCAKERRVVCHCGHSGGIHVHYICVHALSNMYNSSCKLWLKRVLIDN